MIHIIELTTYGHARHLGELIRETPSRYTTRKDGPDGTLDNTRLKTKNMFRVETDDPAGICRKFEEKWKACSPVVDYARASLTTIEGERARLSRLAAFGAAELDRNTTYGKT